MKKRVSVIFAVLVAVIMSFSLMACGPIGGTDGAYKVTFDANGGKFGTAQTTMLETEDGVLAALPDAPALEGKTFAGYNFEKDGSGDKVTLDTKYTKNTTVYAQWVSPLSELIKNLIEADGVTIGIKTSATSKNSTEAETTETTVVKSGNTFKATNADGDESVINLDTGYVYDKNEDGKFEYSQLLPAGYPDYIASLAGDIDLSELDEFVEYEDGTYTLTIDLADTVNTYLKPILDAYKKDETLFTLINAYLDMLDTDIATLLDEGIIILDGIKEVPLGDLFEDDGTLDALLAQIGVAEDKIDEAKNRKVGEMILGAIDYIETAIGDMMPSDVPLAENEPAEGEGEESSFIDTEALIDGIFFSEVTADELAEFKDTLEELSGVLVLALRNIPVRTIVDEIGTEYPDVKVLIAKQVEFTAIKATIDFHTTSTGEIDAINGVFDLQHNYNNSTPTDEYLGFIADNNYHFELDLMFADYTSSPKPFELALVDFEMDSERYVVKALIPEGSGDIVVYFESAGSTLTLKTDDYGVAEVVYYATTDGNKGDYAAWDGIGSYDATTKCFTLNRSQLNGVFNQDYYSSDYTIVWCGDVSDGTNDCEIVIELYSSPSQMSVLDVIEL